MRARLGHQDSATTLNEALKHFRTEVVARFQMPPLPESLIEPAEALWQAALAAAHETLAAERDKACDAVAAAEEAREEQLAAAGEARSLLEASNAGLTARVESLVAERDAAQAQIQALLARIGQPS